VHRAYVRPRSSPVRRQLNQKIIVDLDQFIQGNKVGAMERTTDGLKGCIVLGQQTSLCLSWRHRHYVVTSTRDAQALFFCGTPTPGLEKLGLQTPTPALKKPDSDSAPKIRLWLWPQDLLCDIIIVCLFSSNKICKLVYCTNRVSVVKWIAHKSNRLQHNYTKIQMKQIGPGVGVSFKWETPTQGQNQTPRDSRHDSTPLTSTNICTRFSSLATNTIELKL